MKKNGVILKPGSGDDKEKKNVGQAKYLSNTVMQLKKICNHPFMFDDVDKGMAGHIGLDPENGVSGPDLWRACVSSSYRNRA